MSSILVIDDSIKPEEASDHDLAKEVIYALEKTYPGHPWGCSFQGGALIIRHQQIANVVQNTTGRDGFGSVLPPHLGSTRKVAVQSAVKHAGELLEVFGMPRGKWQEDKPPVCPDWKRGKTRGFH